MVDIEKAKVMLWSAGGLLVASIAATGALVWNFASFVSAERDAQAERMGALRDEMAEIGDGLSIQAVQMTALKDQLVLRMETLTRDQQTLREDMRRQETATASELREIRADIRSIGTSSGTKEDGKQ